MLLTAAKKHLEFTPLHNFHLWIKTVEARGYLESSSIPNRNKVEIVSITLEYTSSGGLFCVSVLSSLGDTWLGFCFGELAFLSGRGINLMISTFKCHLANCWSKREIMNKRERNGDKLKTLMCGWKGNQGSMNVKERKRWNNYQYSGSATANHGNQRLTCDSCFIWVGSTHINETTLHVCHLFERALNDCEEQWWRRRKEERKRN